jgi:hypothetical protein
MSMMGFTGAVVAVIVGCGGRGLGARIGAGVFG